MTINLDDLIRPYFEQFPDEWLLFEVTQTDREGWPKQVRFVAHHPDREQLTNIALEKEIDRTLVRYAGETTPAGMEAIL